MHETSRSAVGTAVPPQPLGCSLTWTTATLDFGARRSSQLELKGGANNSAVGGN